MFDRRLNSAGAKCARGVSELRNIKWLNSNLTYGTCTGGRSGFCVSIGLWSRNKGCVADHIVRDVLRMLLFFKRDLFS